MYELKIGLASQGVDRKKNLDRAGFRMIDKRLIGWVLDGVTPLSEFGDIWGNSENDVEWLISLIHNRLEHANLDVDNVVPQVANILEQANRDYTARYKGSLSAVPRYAWPLSTISLCCISRLSDDCHSIDCYSLGDSPVWVQHGGTIYELVTSRASKKSEQALLSLNDSEKLENLIKRRDEQNSRRDQWLIGIRPQAALHMMKQSLTFEGKFSILIMSDGFEAMCSTCSLRTPSELFDAINNGSSLNSLIGELRAHEKSQHLHSIKQHDDSSVLFIQNSCSK